jgi:hypothetical protein
MIDSHESFEDIERRLRDAEAQQFGMQHAGELGRRTEAVDAAIRAAKPRFVEAVHLEHVGFQGDFRLYEARLITDLTLGRHEFEEALDQGFRHEWPFVIGACTDCGAQIRLPSALVHVEGAGELAHWVTNYDTDSPGKPCICPMHGPGTDHYLAPVTNRVVNERPKTVEPTTRRGPKGNKGQSAKTGRRWISRG